MFTIFKTKFLVRIIYKNGVTQDFWVFRFEYKKDNGNTTVEWQSVNRRAKPIMIGVDDIVAVFQIKVRENIFSHIAGYFNK